MEELTKQHLEYHVPMYYCYMMNQISNDEKCSWEDLPRHKKLIFKKVFEKLVSNLEASLKSDK